MNLGKFQKKLKEQFEESVKIETPVLKVAMYHFMPIAVKIIKELERALDAKKQETFWNKHASSSLRNARSERMIAEFNTYKLAVKRYKGYGVE